MKLDRNAFLALAMGTALSLGTVACSDQRAGRNNDNTNASQTASEERGTGAAAGTAESGVRTDEENDVNAGADARTKGDGAAVSGKVGVGDKSVSGRVGGDVDVKKDRDRTDRNR